MVDAPGPGIPHEHLGRFADGDARDDFHRRGIDDPHVFAVIVADIDVAVFRTKKRVVRRAAERDFAGLFQRLRIHGDEQGRFGAL